MKSNIELKTYNTEVDNFIASVIKKTSEHNIKFIMSLTDYVKFGNSETKSNGYFIDGDAPELAFSFKGDFSIWLTTLIHESCHTEQYLENDPLWIALKREVYGVEEDEDLLFDWIDNLREVDPHTIKSLINDTKYMELDCEIRATVKMMLFNLPLDKDLYVKRANAYVNFYTYMGMKRKWYIVGKEPYNDPKIIGLMSDKFDMDYDNLSEELISLYDECVKE